MSFKVPILIKWNTIIFPLNIFFQTHHHWLYLKLDRALTGWLAGWLAGWLTDWQIQQVFISEWIDLRNSVVSCFHFGHLYFQHEITFWLIHLAITNVFTIFDSHIFKRSFPILIHFLWNTFLCNFIFIFWLAILAFMGPLVFPTIYSTMQVRLICFCIFKSRVLVSCRNSFFWFLSK